MPFSVDTVSFNSRLKTFLLVDLKRLCCKQCGSRLDCSRRSSLIWGRTVCPYAELSHWCQHLHGRVLQPKPTLNVPVVNSVDPDQTAFLADLGPHCVSVCRIKSFA